MTTVGSYSFNNCTNLKNVTLGRAVPSIGSYAFNGCTNLSKVDISNIKSWMGISFGNNTANPLYYAKSLYVDGKLLTKLNIPNEVTEIKPYAFYNCEGLTSVYVPTTVTSVGQYAFAGCPNLESMYVGWNMPIKSVNANSFYDYDGTYLTTLYVPKGTAKKYGLVDVWKNFYDIVEANINAESISINKEQCTVNIGEEIQLTAIILPSDIPNQDVVWKSSNETVATVNGGIVYGLSAGTATITATTNDGTNLSASCEVTVQAPRYKVTFTDWDGSTISEESLEYGKTIKAPADPKREGYTFTGWTPEVDATVPSHDVSYKATYSINSYKVTYYVGTEIVHEDIVIYGEAIPAYTYEPSEERYTFLGWEGEKYETMPAHDISYTANISDGINSVQMDSSSAIVFTIDGRLISKSMKLDDLNSELAPDIYIINGVKRVIK